ncbi:MAG: TonB-dependent receptor plug domain-containing protein, partial [Sphingomonas sp.]|nr:TonB-dependent receptor plug domain-containing protein [Sphingomonas sp.]
MRLATRALLLATLSPFAFASPALAQDQTVPPAPDATNVQPQPSQEPTSEIVVTGTRRSDRTVADSPVPVDVIGTEQIVNTGQTDTNKILNTLVPAFNFPTPSIADGSDALRPATLRGLSPDQTLVLVNGKRRHVAALLNINGTIGRGSAAVDMNLIPGLAISRIEVLRDGAAAQYGSDAIAGVINIQLKNAKRGGRASITAGKYITTVNDVDRVTGLEVNSAGQPILDPTDNRYFVPIVDGDRKVRDGEQGTLGVNVGLPIGQNGFVNLTGEYVYRQRTNRAGYDLRPNFNRPTAAFDPRELDFDRLQFRFGDPKTRAWSLFLNSGYDLSADWEVYAFASLGHRGATSAANWRQQSAAANRDFSVLLPNQTPTAANFVPLTDIGFLPLIETDLDDYAGTIGVRGQLGAGWKMDLSAGRGHNSFDYQVHDSLNTSFGPDSQTDFDAGGLRYGQNIFNLDFTNEYQLGMASPLAVAVGAEFRQEQFKIRPGDQQSYADGPYFRPAITT